MSDLISRQAAIDEILDLTGFASIIELFEDVEEHDYLRDKRLGGINDAIDAVLMVATAQPEPKWIPCSEKMPDKEGRYLCTVGASFHNPRVMTYAPDTFLDGDCNTWRAEDGAYCFNWFVEAWMPLPAPFDRGNDDKQRCD